MMSKLTYPDLLFAGRFNTYLNRTISPAPSFSFSGKIVLLVDESTRSHAEFSAMGLQAACNTTTIGTTTAGVIGNITKWIPLPGGYSFRFSGLGVFYPDGKMVHQHGVHIDIHLSPKELIKNKKVDYVVERSIQYIQE